MTTDDSAHLDPQGRAFMVDVGDKPVTDRRAVATARLVMTPSTAGRLAADDLPKSDAVPVARVAGIMAAKRTPDLIPLCHPVAVAGVEVDITVDRDQGVVTVTAAVEAADRTGVEMEALVAASTAALTLYDMVKAVERGVVVEQLGLVEKTGGQHGDWRR